MITPELLSYIRAELGKGRTREEIRIELVKGGGWKEEDLSEAFRIVIPMQGFFAPTSTSTTTPTISNTGVTTKHDVNGSSPQNRTGFFQKYLKAIIIIAIILVCAEAFYLYRSQIYNLWGKVMPEFSMPSFDFKKITGFFGGDKSDNKAVAVKESKPVTSSVPAAAVVKDCGTSVSPDLRDTSSYENSVFSCLGNNAISCSPARAVLNDSLFPTDLQIVKKNIGEEAVCSFRLAYADDSVLVDPTGSKLAGQYVMCPLSVVKMVDEKAKTLSFKAPSVDNPSLYAGQIYFYGTLGLFMEQNVDKSKILALGCSGSYIDSVIASYKSQQ